MARTNNLTNFLSDVATAIKAKKGDNTPIPASNFDTEIANLSQKVVIPNGMKFQSSTFSELPEWLDEADFSNITNASSMFSSCTNLKKIENKDFSNASNKHLMFNGCTNLEEINNLDMSNTSDTTTSGIFQNCSKLETIKNLDMSNSIQIGYMFQNCTSLKNITNLKTTNVLAFNYWFQNCKSLEDAPELDTSGAVGPWGFSNMFKGCTNLTNVPVYDGSAIKSKMGNMFGDCPNLTNTSLDNILQMCISATSYTGTKTLAFLGITTTNYPAATIQALPHYQAFINAGWTIS